MKKYAILLVLMLFLTGCGTSENEGGASFTINESKVEAVDVQFKEEIVTITDKESIGKILEMTADNKKESSEAGKGWTYRLIFRDKDDKEIADIEVLNNGCVIYDGAKYSCSNLSIDELDAISGIDREKE